MHKIRRTGRLFVILFIVTLLTGIMALPALAEEESLPMKQLNYSIWPEYDTNDVLVIYSGNLVNNTGKPFSGLITYRMPKGARVNMVCELEKGMVCQKFEIKSQADYDEVVWRTSRTIQPGEEFPVMFEYNYLPMQAAGERNMDVSFMASFPVEQLNVEIKQPLRSTSFTVDPQPQSQGQVDDSLTTEKFNVFNYSYSDVKKDDKLSFNIKYTKEDSEPSVDKNAAAPTTGTPQGDSAGKKVDSTVLVLVIAFIALLAVFIFYAMNSNRNQVPASKSRQNQKQKTSPKPGKPVNNGLHKSKPRVTQDSAVQIEKKKVRKLLLDGKISEETYRQLVAELDEE
ncbi:MAG: hypothetical protein ACYC2T_02510 [Bacillota bacterium]